MSSKPPVPGPTLAEKREKTVQLLIDSFAADRLSVEEFESRLDRAHRAPDAGTLEGLVSDLPVAAPASPVGSTAPITVARPVQLRPQDVQERKILVAIMGGFERKGTWTPARKIVALALMGGGSLDFREALMPAGIIEVEIFAMMGGVEIIVPPGVAVDCSGFALMGGFEETTMVSANPGPDAPTIRIRGLAIMGGVEVQVRLPGESARDANSRMRQERRQLRRERRRELP
jgi:hypothetical protein